MVLFRLLPFVVFVAILVTGAYYGGKYMELWDGPPKFFRRKPPHTGKGVKAVGVTNGEGKHDELSTVDALITDIKLEAGVLQHNVWLYVAKQHRVIRVRVRSANEGDGDVLEIEVLSRTKYDNAGVAGGATVQLFAFPAAKGQSPWVRDVFCKIGGPPEFELPHAGDMAEGTASTPPAQEALDRLKVAVRHADGLA